MTAVEREALYEAFLSENGTYSGTVWKESFAVEDSTYLLFVNGGQTAQHISESYSVPKMSVKLLTSGSTASYASGNLTLTLRPGGIAFLKMNSTAEPGIYREDLALIHLEDGVIWQGDTAVLYREYNGAEEILEFIENGDMVKLGAGAHILKAFFWESPICPVESAQVYTTP